MSVTVKTAWSVLVALLPAPAAIQAAFACASAFVFTLSRQVLGSDLGFWLRCWSLVESRIGRCNGIRKERSSYGTASCCWPFNFIASHMPHLQDQLTVTADSPQSHPSTTKHSQGRTCQKLWRRPSRSEDARPGADVARHSRLVRLPNTCARSGHRTMSHQCRSFTSVLPRKLRIYRARRNRAQSVLGLKIRMIRQSEQACAPSGDLDADTKIQKTTTPGFA